MQNDKTPRMLTGENLSGLGCGGGFSDTPTKAQFMKELDKIAMEDSVKRMGRQATNWER